MPKPRPRPTTYRLLADTSSGTAADQSQASAASSRSGNRSRAADSASSPRHTATSRATQTSEQMKLLVAATLRSGPACCGSTWAAAAAKGEPGALTIATLQPPAAVAARSVATMSGLAPDCEMASTRARLRSSSAP